MASKTRRSLPVTLMVFGTGYLTYYLMYGVFFVAMVPLAVLMAPFPDAKRAVLGGLCRQYARCFTQWYLPFLGTYRILEKPTLPDEHPRIYVANHRGRLDGFLMVGLIEKAGITIKTKHARYPFFAQLVRHFDFVPVDASSPQQAAKTLAWCRDFLARGRNLVVFPEGVRSLGSRMRPFRGLAFQLSIETGIPIVPTLVQCNVRFMAKRPGTFFPREPVRYRVRCLPAIRAEAHETPKQFADRTYRVMQRELRAMDALGGDTYG